MATTTRTTFTGIRVTRHIPLPYSKVLARLQSTIAGKDNIGLQILKHTSSVDEFEKAVKPSLGPHGFMQFAAIDHAAWIGLYGVHVGKQLNRIVFGNPLVALTMMKHDVNVGLFAPVEALLVDLGEADGTNATTDVVYLLPSSLVHTESEKDNERTRELKKAVLALDAKLEQLWTWVESNED